MPKTLFQSPFANAPSNVAGRSGIEKLAESNKPQLPEIDFTAGGKWFSEAIAQYGVNERLEPLRISPCLLEHAELLGDFRVALVATTGAAQVFKSLNQLQLAVAIITIAQRNFIFVLAQAGLIPKIVPTQFKPIVQHWEERLGLARKALPSDSRSMALHQSIFGTGRFLSANNASAKSKEREGQAKAAGGAVSVPTDVLLMDERSQYSISAIDQFDRRLLQGRIPSSPKRITGTPGAGGGIELEISKGDYDFYPHCRCSQCNQEIELHPFGCLLTSVEDDPGKPARYLGEDGRPIVSRNADGSIHHGWHHYDPQAPVSSAYYACPHCFEELTRGDRIENSYFKCRKTGVKLRDFLDSLPPEYPRSPISAGVTLSPLIRDSVSAGAADIIKKGIEGNDPDDWQQQEIGVASSSTNGGITIEMLRRAIATNCPDWPVYCYAWGLDQGTTEHWFARVRYRLPPDRIGEPALTPMQRYVMAHREIMILSDIAESDLGAFVEDCEGGCCDVDPGRSDAVAWQQKYKSVVLADQRGRREMAKDVVRSDTVQVGRSKINVQLIDHHQLQTNILNAFAASCPEAGGSRVSLPRSVDPTDLGAMSAARHLTTSAKDPETGTWTRPADNKDDLFKAIVFAETYFYMKIFGLLPGSGDIAAILKS